MSEWISVKDRLPTQYKSYLVYLKGHGVYVRWFSEGKFFKSGYAAWALHKLINLNETSKYPIDKPLKNVTHWQPLPEPPK